MIIRLLLNSEMLGGATQKGVSSEVVRFLPKKGHNCGNNLKKW